MVWQYSLTFLSTDKHLNVSEYRKNSLTAMQKKVSVHIPVIFISKKDILLLTTGCRMRFIIIYLNNQKRLPDASPV
jgi:hypothetical protein